MEEYKKQKNITNQKKSIEAWKEDLRYKYFYVDDINELLKRFAVEIKANN